MNVGINELGNKHFVYCIGVIQEPHINCKHYTVLVKEND